MPRFVIFKERFAALNQDDIQGRYRAVPQDHLLKGLFNPRHDSRVHPDSLDVVEAKTAEEAVEKYRDRRADAFM